MNRPVKLVLGLVAGAVLMAPNYASAHSATGLCVNCHTMHNSQDGASMNGGTAQPNLLMFSCVGCHVGSDNGLDNDGRGGLVNAPQVGPQAVAGDIDSGGYFSDGVTPADYARTHNVVDIYTATTGADTNMTTGQAPGGTMGVNNGTGGPLLSCTSCHDLVNIGHAPAGSARDGVTTSYRMLNALGVQMVAGQGSANFETDGTLNVYDATSMNLFCAVCHGGFHGVGNQFDAGASAWLLHPTDVSVNSLPPAYAGNNVLVPVGDAGTNNIVMCISCHRPHGSANPDLLRFAYGPGANQAGDFITSVGCETCHGQK